MLLFLWLVVVTVATASASLPRATENRAWEKIFSALELRSITALQVAEAHQMKRRGASSLRQIKHIRSMAGP